MRLLYLFVLITIVVSCKSATSPKTYGLINRNILEIPTIDTSNHIVRPITDTIRQYILSNQSTDKKINFVCKVSFKDLSECWVSLQGNHDIIVEHTEKHVVAPQGEVKLDIDSNSEYRVLKYEIIEANIINK
jgi:hypothetical protein